MASMASVPRSSHMVPNRATPRASRSTWSSTAIRVLITSKNALLAPSPPAAKVAMMFSALYPRDVNASTVLSLPSMARIENSLMASPTLSRFQAVPSAPAWRMLNIPSASKPSFANWEEYSLMVSISSPE